MTKVNDPNISLKTITSQKFLPETQTSIKKNHTKKKKKPVKVAKSLSDGIHKDCSDQAREIFIDRMIKGHMERGKVTSHAKNLGINPRTAMRLCEALPRNWASSL